MIIRFLGDTKVDLLSQKELLSRAEELSLGLREIQRGFRAEAQGFVRPGSPWGSCYMVP